jgi:tetratricopeptide (TPR) repeat protein
MRYLFFILIMVCSFASQAQGESPEEIIRKSRSFSQGGDFENAVMILKRASEATDNNIMLQVELANVLAQAGRFKEALPLAKKLAAADDVDVQAVQIAGLIFNNTDENNAYEKLYKKAFKLYPDNGRLYADYGEYLLIKEKIGCITSWEKGMKADPSFAGNYYFASKYYNANNNILLSTWCAENFINLEYLTARTVEIKNILYKNLRTILTNSKLENDYSIKNNDFFKAYLSCMNLALQNASNNGINAESLTLIRTRFILIWNEKYEASFPCKLFEYHRQLLIDGTFEAYNQWVFGSVENFNSYQNWIENNSKANDALTKYRTSRIYKIPADQYFGL